VENLATGDLTTQLSEIHTEMKDKLLKAQDQQTDNADKSQKAHSIINIGNKVWILHCNLKINHPYDKLNFRHLRPFPIVK
jgi:hypothetical protein